MDPNWFYSSLAQSTAAIVGVLAAVLVPRLLQQLSDVRNAKIELIRDFLALRSNVQDTLQATSGYLGYLVESLPKLRVAYEGADASDFNIRRIESFFDPTMGREDRKGLDIAFDELERDEQWCRRAVPVLQNLAEVTDLASLSDILPELLQIRMACANGAKARLADHVQVAHKLEALVAKFQANVVPRSLNWMLTAFIGLLLVGVIAPLAYLYAGADPMPKWLMLIGFIAGLGALMVFFFQLKKEVEDAGRLELPARDRLPEPIILARA